MELRLKFNEDEQNYDRFRPGYPDALMQDVIESFHEMCIRDSGQTLDVTLKWNEPEADDLLNFSLNASTRERLELLVKYQDYAPDGKVPAYQFELGKDSQAASWLDKHHLDEVLGGKTDVELMKAGLFWVCEEYDHSCAGSRLTAPKGCCNSSRLPRRHRRRRCQTQYRRDIANKSCAHIPRRPRTIRLSSAPRQFFRPKPHPDDVCPATMLPANLFPAQIDRPGPVSYTHLDVYKRQA